MFPKLPTDGSLPDIPNGVPLLHYEQPELGVNYWVHDHFFPDAEAKVIANRCFNHKKWRLGYPHTAEKWPGMRFKKALKTKELKKLEAWVKQVTGKDRLWIEKAEAGASVETNVAQLVGEKESGPLPHSDSRNLCRYAVVMYLSPEPKPDSGTTFYRLRYPNGAAGGNMVQAPYMNLRDALKVKTLPPEAWYEECNVENRFNRVLLYKANMVHSATGYFGEDKRSKRLTAVFFWMTE